MKVAKYYACNNKNEVAAVREFLKQKGVPDEKIEQVDYDEMIINKGFIPNKGPENIYADALGSHMLLVIEE